LRPVLPIPRRRLRCALTGACFGPTAIKGTSATIAPNWDFSAGLQVFPSLTDPGRVRLEGDLRSRYEVLKDFFITLALQTSNDTRPPSADTPKSDFTTTLSLTWKF
jgi:hypothetical protein